MPTWKELQPLLLKKTLTEAKALQLLEEEKAGARRGQSLLRIYGRYSALRSQRERAELHKITVRYGKGVRPAK